MLILGAFLPFMIAFSPVYLIHLSFQDDVCRTKSTETISGKTLADEADELLSKLMTVITFDDDEAVDDEIS